ncbi:MAG: GrpB family protein [Saprospiraceae bacterium]
MVSIEAWNKKWPEEFQELKEIYLEHLKMDTISIEHVGSTSVVGLPAKPCLDIDIIVEQESDIPKVIQKLSVLGYRHIGDLGIKGREAFKRENDETPFSNQKDKKWMRHNLYVGLKGIPSIENHLLFRDFLRNNAEVRIAYGNLKEKLAIQYQHDQPGYTEAKSDFILKVLSQLGFNDELLSDIREQNKA